MHLATLAVGGTGVVYAFLRYALAPADPYAVVGHPLQPTVQHLHLLSAPLLVFAAGLVWRNHAWKHWRLGVAARRRTGVVLLANLLPMVASGYLLQTAVSPGWRRAWVVLHLVSSGLWLIGYLAHLLSPRPGAKSGEAGALDQPSLRTKRVVTGPSASTTALARPASTSKVSA